MAPNTHAEPVWTRGRVVRAAVIVAAAYYVGVQVGLWLTIGRLPVSTLWPPNAIVTAALLLTPTRFWWAMILAVLPVHVVGELGAGIPLPMVLSWFTSNVSEALIGAGVMRALEPSPRLDSFRRVLVFFGGPVFLASFLSSFLDSAFVMWNQWGTAGFWDVWGARFRSNALATLALVPVIVHSATRGVAHLRTVPPWRYLEVWALTLGLLLVCMTLFQGPVSGFATPALLYAPLPFLLWSALRFGPGGVSASLLVIALFAISAAIRGHVPFDATSPTLSAISVQLFLIVISIPTLALGAVMAERGNAEARLRASEERFSLAFRLSPEAFAIIRRIDGTIVDINARWESMFGHSREESSGRTPVELNLFAYLEDAREVLLRLVSQGQLRESELTLRNKEGGQLHAMITAQSVMLGDEPCFLVSVRDVTEQRRAEMELNEQQAELAHLSRVALVGELSTAMAHELNQPLAAIMANARAGQRLMVREPPDIEEVCRIFEDIVQDDKRAGEVIRRMHDLLHRGELDRQPLDVNEVVREILQLLNSESIRREVLVETELAPVLPRVPGDRVQLQQVLINLLLNAFDAVALQPKEERRVTIRTAGHGNGVAISVIDRGTGIPSAKLEQVFEPFYTSKRQGLGLGLAICRTIVTAHGGRLWAVNNPDRGATFHLELGRADHAA
jgi:PAS domain S-box-containing protein